MADLMWPVTLVPNASQLSIIDSSGRFVSPLNGFTRTVSRPGERIRMSMSFQNLDDTKRALLRSLIAKLRGGSNRIYVPDHSYQQRGVFPSGDVKANPTFALGTSDWFTSASMTATVHDRVYRMTRLLNNAGNVGVISMSGSGRAAVQFFPYLWRVFASNGRGDYSAFLTTRMGLSGTTTEYSTTLGKGMGMITNAAVPYGATVVGAIVEPASTVYQAGDYWETPFASLTRCALVDNGQNWCTHSDDFSNAAWTKTRSSVAATATTLPDGSSGTTACLHEDATAANNHFIDDSIAGVNSAITDLTFSVALKASNRTWAAIEIVESTGSTTIRQYINLSTGALGLAQTGANWADLRSYVTPLGNGWYKLTIVGRKTSAGTTATARIFAASADATVVFDGLNQDSIFMWRATFAVVGQQNGAPLYALMGVPTRLVQTTGSALTTGTLQQLAGGLHTKGWPVSTNELLKEGDQVQIDNQLLMVAEALNSDAGGCAYLKVLPALHTAPTDSAPIVINQPMGRFLLEQQENGWSNIAGEFANADITLVEAI